MAPLDESQIVIIVSSVAGALFMLGVLFLYRYCTHKHSSGYERVAHTLDEEEQAFKRTLEQQGDDIDDLFSGFDEHMELNPADLEQIELVGKILEKRHRSQLSKEGKNTGGEIINGVQDSPQKDQGQFEEADERVALTADH